MTTLVVALLIGLTTNILSRELDFLAPAAAKKLLKIAVRVLPKRLRNRMLSEWQGHLADVELPHRKALAGIACESIHQDALLLRSNSFRAFTLLTKAQQQR